MRKLALLPLLALAACATVKPRPEPTPPPEDGSAGGWSSLPPLHLEVLGQGIVPSGCAAGGVCLVGSLTSTGAVSGTTGTFTGIISGASLMTSGGIPFQGDGTTATGARLYLGSLNASNAGIWGATSGAFVPTSSNYSFLTDNGGSNVYFNATSSINFRISTATKLAMSSTGTLTSSVASGSNAFAVDTNGARVDFGAGASDYASSDGTTVAFQGGVSLGNGCLISSVSANTLACATTTATNQGITMGTGAVLTKGSSKNAGTITLAAGTGTATVNAGMTCVCSSQTANHAFCTLASTTLTATGTGTDLVNYHCL